MDAAIREFDHYLASQGLRFRAVIIGGAALIALGIIKRTTKDVDCLEPALPDDIKDTSRRFASERPDLGLSVDWLNNGPLSLQDDLPDGWRERLVPVFTGAAMALHTLGRLDLLRTKLFAYCDRQQDEDDCAAMSPTVEELAVCLPWLLERDSNPHWPANVKASLRRLAERLGYEYQP
jgi:hypothetical protein